MTNDLFKNIIKRSRVRKKYLKIVKKKKIGNCILNKEIIASLWKEKLKRLTMKT